MPLYEYLCTSCGHRFERIQKFSDPLVATCPQCGGPVEKQVSSPAIQFKGAGWYVNDYAKAGKSDSGKSDSGSAKSDKSTDAAKGGESSPSETAKSESAKSEPAKTDTSASKPASADKSPDKK
ncbi:MAG: zinc ribbon domain-containing protein [Acidobacteriota bacterium]